MTPLKAAFSVLGVFALGAILADRARAANAASAAWFNPEAGLWYDADGYPLPDPAPFQVAAPSSYIAPWGAPDDLPPYAIDDTWDAFEPPVGAPVVAPDLDDTRPPEADAYAGDLPLASDVDMDAARAAAAPGIIAQAINAVTQPITNFEPLDNANVKAFLDMIGFSEGATYDTFFGGGGAFASYADHPRTIISANGYRSSAAGKYQILRKTWDDVAPKIGATDFSPYWQDRAAVFLLKRRGALADVLAGRFDSAINKTRKEWASLPGAGYGQPERSLSRLRAVYANAGGQFETV